MDIEVGILDRGGAHAASSRFLLFLGMERGKVRDKKEVSVALCTLNEKITFSMPMSPPSFNPRGNI